MRYSFRKARPRAVLVRRGREPSKRRDFTKSERQLVVPRDTRHDDPMPRTKPAGVRSARHSANDETFRRLRLSHGWA
jgi:hypothetical protein